jgi:hypothetical protein
MVAFTPPYKTLLVHFFTPFKTGHKSKQRNEQLGEFDVEQQNSSNHCSDTIVQVPS